MPAGVFRKDAAGRYVFVNAWFCQLSNTKPEDYLGKTALEMTRGLTDHPSSNLDVEKAMDLAASGDRHHAAIMQTGARIELEEERVLMGGKKQFLHVVKSPVFNSEGKITGSQGILIDITARKQAEERYRALFDYAPDGIVIAAPDSHCLDANASLCRMLGYTREELIGQGISNIVAQSGIQNLGLALQEIKVKSNEQREWNFRRKDGSIFAAEVMATVMPDSNLLAMIRDITGRKKLEEQFRQSQKMEGIGQLAAGVAHDFNNMLAAIQIQTDLLVSRCGLSGNDLGYADEINSSVQRAAALTRQLLLFSRHEVFQPRDLELSESITNTAKMLKRILGENVQMQLKLAAQPMVIHADAGMMDQVLLNLAVNARDAMSQGGQLVIETSGVEFDDVAAAQSAQMRAGSFVCLSVSDNGSGIPAEILPKIFEPFFTTKGVGKGTGLGLATVFGIVQQHQGWVNVYSEVGRGTTLRIYLPRLARSAGATAAPPAPPAMRGGPETILLVEDDIALRLSVRQALARLGYRILEAPTGVKALEVWSQNHDEIRLLLTDLIMPDGMTGKDLALRLSQENPALKVVYMSGYSAEVAGQDFPLHEGVNFLAKPFQGHKLARIIREKLDAPA